MFIIDKIKHNQYVQISEISDLQTQQIKKLIKVPYTDNFTLEKNNKVVGFCIYEINEDKISVNHYGIKKDGDFAKAFSILVENLKNLLTDSIISVTLNVREKELETQLLLKGLGFRAKLIKKYYDDGEDTFSFLFRRKPECEDNNGDISNEKRKK